MRCRDVSDPRAMGLLQLLKVEKLLVGFAIPIKKRIKHKTFSTTRASDCSTFCRLKIAMQVLKELSNPPTYILIGIAINALVRRRVVYSFDDGLQRMWRDLKRALRMHGCSRPHDSAGSLIQGRTYEHTHKRIRSTIARPLPSCQRQP